jgi:16S rRNA (cytosine967-C5)-methyltransferase
VTPAARLSAACEVLADIATRRRPAADALKDWGLSHRFAGSKDRSAIATLVFDVLRHRASCAFLMKSDEPRALVLAMLHLLRQMDIDAIAALCSGEGHAPQPLTEDERISLNRRTLDTAPDWVQADVPEWSVPHLRAAFADDMIAQGQALAMRAPLDVRVNRLKASREKMHAALAHLNPIDTPYAPDGLRIPLLSDGRAPALGAEPAYVKGQIEIQDEGSQLVSMLCGAQAGQQVLDLCAGGGGKSLFFAAAMENRGQIYATDIDGRRLMPIIPRLERAGARNVQVRAPRGQADVLSDLNGRCDLVVVDAPCTGSGTWRRNPDAKWRMRESALALRCTEQKDILQRASGFVRDGGVLAYITCSLFPEENEMQIDQFLAQHPEFLPRSAEHNARMVGLESCVNFASTLGAGMRLSPLTTQTDGFYCAILVKNGSTHN